MDDVLIWKLAQNGKYSTKYFCEEVEWRKKGIISSFLELIWHGLTPPRTEVFLWLVLEGVTTREFLV